MSYESLSKRFPLFSLKEFRLESLELSSENIISFSQNWEMSKQKLLKDFPLNLAFYNFILEIRESLPYEENNVFHTLLGHVFYLTGNLVDLKRMIVPSEALLILYQSLANFHLGQFQRAKDLSKILYVILDTSNINLSCFIYSLKLYLDSYYFSESELTESIQILKNLINVYKNKPSELHKDYLILAQTILIIYENPSNDELEALKKDISRLDSWSAGICQNQLIKYYIKINDQSLALKASKEAIRLNEHLPNNPDRFTPYLLLYNEYKQELGTLEAEIKLLFPSNIEYLIKKQNQIPLNSEEKKLLQNIAQNKTSLPKYFQSLLN